MPVASHLQHTLPPLFGKEDVLAWQMRTSNMTRNRLFQTVAAGIVLASTTTGAAYAVPSYAYSHLSFTGFTLGGVIATPGVTVNTTSVTSTDGANYPASP